MKTLEWIESSGGPLLLASELVATKWLGTESSEHSSDLTDYQRACDIIDAIDVVELGHIQAVVLGDEPDRTAFLESPGSPDLFILRWRWAESEESLLHALRSELDQLPFKQSGTFSTIAGEHLLFDSAYAGEEIGESLRVSLNADKYILETALFQPNKNTCAMVHRLRQT